MSTTHQQHGAVGEESTVFGLLAEFDTPEDAVRAAQRAYAAGYRAMEAYSPFPVEGLAEALGYTKNRVPLAVLIGGLSGATIAFLLQTYTAVVDYPLNIGGRPYFSWPAFMPVTFELAVLLAAFSAVIGMLVMSGLPRLHHPIFNAPSFARASRDGFFLLILSEDPLYSPQGTRQFLAESKPQDITEVES